MSRNRTQMISQQNQIALCHKDIDFEKLVHAKEHNFDARKQWNITLPCKVISKLFALQRSDSPWNDCSGHYYDDEYFLNTMTWLAVSWLHSYCSIWVFGLLLNLDLKTVYLIRSIALIHQVVVLLTSWRTSDRTTASDNHRSADIETWSSNVNEASGLHWEDSPPRLVFPSAILLLFRRSFGTRVVWHSLFVQEDIRTGQCIQECLQRSHWDQYS